MSFEEQERALFDLLFDKTLRDRFCSEPMAAFSEYELNDEELRDFAEIRPDALELDAKMRRSFLLTHICRAYPISFAIVSSLGNGRELLTGLVDSQTMRCNSIERPTVFGTRLREALLGFNFDTRAEQALIIAILEAELAMAMTSASIKREVIQAKKIHDDSVAVSDNWTKMKIKLAAHVGAAIIPQPYLELKRGFCSVADTDLWNALKQNPVSKSLRNKILKHEMPRLLVVRARLNHKSYCDPQVDHQTVELSDGFASLFQHVNGTTSAEQIMAELKKAGAEDKILKGVQSGFKQLLGKGMLEIVASE
ncbi:MAG: hypothetical protein ACI9SC_000989 [Gammaproteobacteria bacterium]